MTVKKLKAWQRARKEANEYLKATGKLPPLMFGTLKVLCKKLHLVPYECRPESREERQILRRAALRRWMEERGTDQ